MTLERRGVIRLIFKKEDRSDLKFYRPISLLNVDVKIITKTLALRLGRMLPSIISNDQTCIPGRNIASNLHTLHDLVKYLHLMSSMAWVKRCYSEKSKNLNKLLVFEALYPSPGENADLANLN